MVKIASWNINSVRLRMPQVERFLADHAPDVLCLQEIKTVEETFPRDAFDKLGYVHHAVHGQKGYHGVATVSRVPLREVSRYDWQANGEARHVGVELQGAGQGLVLENVYIPAGGDVADRAVNPKFGQKLDFLERMTRWSEKIDRPTLLVGDFNIAPLECDVYNHKALLKTVSHTPIEVETLGRLQDA
ncbi:MAG: endonuclease/exonuclease/phosphatase family protein, partial [Sphingomonadaceae bacterium]|nr:endonuclease/exonuclease/phosphatase family protein [Sphingomonadaceae bacterium]